MITKKSFSYNTRAFSEKAFNNHITLYNGYVDKNNEITEALKATPDYAEANAVYSKLRSLKKGQTFTLDSVILHEEYFRNMSAATLTPGKNTLKLFDAYFGSYEKWLADFTATAKCARGWCVLAYDQRSKTAANFLSDSHDNGIISLSYPILVLDMYEHAYYMDYGTDKASYITNFVRSIDWAYVEAKASKLIL